MNTAPILITSFQPWRAHQASNSSDDLLAALQKKGQLPADSLWLKQVPVSFELAPIRVIGEIYRRRPRAVICCGMAERRTYLSVEQQASRAEKTLTTTLNLPLLLQNTQFSEISCNAGSYVCNHLYYSVLESVSKQPWKLAAIFIHVPILQPGSRQFVLTDFARICRQLAEQTR